MDATKNNCCFDLVSQQYLWFIALYVLSGKGGCGVHYFLEQVLL